MATSGDRRGRDDKVEALRGLPWAAAAGDDDLRWLGRVADSFTKRAGAVVARQVTPSRWSYLVVSGAVAVGDDVLGVGAVVLPDLDIVAVGDVEVLAFPRQEEPALQRRFPALEAAPVEPRRVPQCPIARAKSAIGMASTA
jgi:hypothetical protein